MLRLAFSKNLPAKCVT